jgi:two-component sensor histidine kinase
MRAAITNITDRKIIDQQLQASLKEKEVLLQEVHRRGKK